MKNTFRLLSFLMVISVLISACGGATKSETSTMTEGKTVEYSLMTSMADGQMAFVGVGGGIDGVKNPTLSANVGDTVKISLTDGDGVEHDVAFPDFNAKSEHLSGKGSTSTFQFVADKPGTFSYHCLIAGHKEAGMEGKLEVTGTAMNSNMPMAAPTSNSAVVAGPVVVSNPPTTGADIVRDPTEIPAEIPAREPQLVRIDLETVEIEGQLADGTTYTYWT
ncbi:MAG TPA: multicopper oxidase domain-containing protein, partial [Anaerolineales bacterium]|nr:multicopper oxidase domain-containing protein [Anaerolineales bacterium]